MTRRDFLIATTAVAATRWIPLRMEASRPIKPVKLAVITDLHHGLAPDAMERLSTFVQATKQRQEQKGLDAVFQLGDFCYSEPNSKECVDLFNTLDLPKVHVLGNHDMDKCDKDAAMKYWGMKSRYGSHLIGGYRFVVLDLNHFKKDSKLNAYANGNYFTDNATHNWADPEQLDWLAKELRSSKEPVILLSHQPLGFPNADGKLPPEQVEVLDIVTKTAKDNPKGAVAACIFGHLHVDRLEHHEGIPCYCQNSASYFWYGGMNAYTKPLYSFMEVTPEGMLKIEGTSGTFAKEPPDESDAIIGRSGSIADRSIPLIRT
ncbi:MAG: metallophosphoesterase [Fimbriimonadaceae bacterium]|nr:metallophosphoesterase [Fimbriimonadaceae bacterium]